MVPEAVRKQAEEADKALDTLIQVQDESAEQPVNPETAEAIQANMETQPGRQPAQDEAIQAESTTIEVDPAQALQNELDLERQRNRTLQGRIDSQLAKAHGENRELKTQVKDLEGRMDELAKADRPPGYLRHITEEEAEGLGDDVLDIQNRIIKGTLEEALEDGDLKDYVNDLVQQSMEAQVVDRAPAPVNEDLFWQSVERHYPGARQINESDQNWFGFLGQHDPDSGLKNRDVGVQAIDTSDVVSLVDLLNRYRPIQQDQHVVEPKPVAVKPERGGAQQIETSPAKPSFTRSNVERFYNDVARNRFPGTKEEATALETEIMEAAQEGRITE